MPERARLEERATRPEPRQPACAAGLATPGLPNAALARLLAPGGSSRARRQAAAALGVRSVARQPAPAPAPAPPQRPLSAFHGQNPATVLELVNKRAFKKVPKTVAEARTQAEDWADTVRATLMTGGRDSGASHWVDIKDNTVKELKDLVDLLISELEDDKGNPRRFKNFHEKLIVAAGLKAQEIGVEFGHNVILETDQWGKFGNDYDEEFKRLDEALKGVEPGRTWDSAKPVRFRRELVYPTNRAVGGSTDPATNTITLYAAGTGKTPYDRSKALNLPAYVQTIQHELGHLVESSLAPGPSAELFGAILDWRRHSWAWVNMPQTATESNSRKERRSVVAESGIADDKLDAWLTQFVMGPLSRSNAVEANGRVFIRAEDGHFLQSIKKAELPQGPEFEYALSNQGDYISELYTFALSRPDWLAGKISRKQLNWWRERVFSMPGDDREVAKQLGVAKPLEAAFLAAVKTKFTWAQADEVLATVQKAAPPAPPAAATP